MNTFFFKQKTKEKYPNQYICRETANGIICNSQFFQNLPGYFSDVDFSLSIGTYHLIDPGKTGRIWLGNVNNVVFNTGGVGVTGFELRFTVLGKYAKIFTKVVPVSSSFIPNNTFALNLLGDRGQPLDLVINTNDSTGWLIACNYTIIESLPGDDLPVVGDTPAEVR